MKLGEFELDTIITGDARELARGIPEHQAALIFADPIYTDADFIEWLARDASRLLKWDGALLMWSNGKWHRENARWLEDTGLRYRYDFACVITGGSAPMNGRIISKANRLLWFDVNGTSKMQDYLSDGYMSLTLPRSEQHGFKWTKNPHFTAQAIKVFTRPDDLIIDPCCGGGTVPAVAKNLGRHFLAFEIDPATADLARERVANAQPLLNFEPEQLSFEATG